MNFGIVGFALTVGWFYYSDILDKFSALTGVDRVGRAVRLPHGWGSSRKVRRRIMAGMGKGSGVSPGLAELAVLVPTRNLARPERAGEGVATGFNQGDLQ